MAMYLRRAILGRSTLLHRIATLPSRDFTQTLCSPTVSDSDALTRPPFLPSYDFFRATTRGFAKGKKSNAALSEYMPEEEVKVAAAERLRISMERIALLKAAERTKDSSDEEEEDDDDDDEEVEDEEEYRKEKERKKEKKKERRERKEKQKKEEEDAEEKGNTTLSKLTAEEVEHRALQAAVLQEWHMLCKERSSKVG